jgi:hypothetical protein
VDFLECLTCELRFTVADAGVGQGLSCPDCGEPLALVALGLPGTPEEVSTALNARHLLSLSHRPDEVESER